MIWKERNLFIRIHGQLNWIEWLLNEIVYGQKDQQFFSFAFFVIHFHWIKKRFLNNRTFSFSFYFSLENIMWRSGRNMLELIVCTGTSSHQSTNTAIAKHFSIHTTYDEGKCKRNKKYFCFTYLPVFFDNILYEAFIKRKNVFDK